MKTELRDYYYNMMFSYLKTPKKKNIENISAYADEIKIYSKEYFYNATGKIKNNTTGLLFDQRI